MMKWLLLLLLPCALFARLNSNGDFQIWNSDGLNIPLSKKIHFSGNAEFRYGDDRKKLYYKHYQGGFRLYRSSHVLFYFAYRHIYHRVRGKWIAEYDPLFDLTFQAGNRRGLFLSNRNRIQYRILGEKLGGKNRWLYRNRSEYVLPYRLTKRNIAPFLAYEFFWQEARGIDQNRLEVGLKIPYHQRTQLNLSYMMRFHKDHQKKWIQHNIVRVDFSLHF